MLSGCISNDIISKRDYTEILPNMKSTDLRRDRTMKNYKTIGIAADHAGYEMKESVKKHLQSKGYTVSDFGTHTAERMDYPDVAHPLALAVEKKEVAIAIALCGSGNGISITLNKHQGVRAAVCWTTELASLARKHNDANICSLPARFIDDLTALQIVDTFLSTDFEGGRHAERVDKIAC